MGSDIPACWRKGSGDYIYNTNGSDVPCSGPGVAGCCVYSSECLSNGFCHNLNSGTGQSGYYMQSCTDQTYGSGACPEACTRFRVPDVVFNYTANLWYCCGYDGQTGLYGCGDPTDQSFAAPPPEQLSTITSLAATGWTLAPSSTSTSQVSTRSETTTSSVFTSPTSVSSLAASATASPTSTPSSLGLSTGAKAGIGIGAALGVLIAVALFGWLFVVRRRRLQKNARSGGIVSREDTRSFSDKEVSDRDLNDKIQNPFYTHSELHSDQVYEMSNDSINASHSSRKPHELGT